MVMTEITNELIYEVLKRVQSDVAAVKQTQADHTQQLLKIREDVHNLRGDDLRRESCRRRWTCGLNGSKRASASATPEARAKAIFTTAARAAEAVPLLTALQDDNPPRSAHAA